MPTKSKLSRSKGDNQAAKENDALKDEEALVVALEKLKCTEDDTKQVFDSLRIPYCSDRKKKSNGDGYYTAS
jgi:hypothetical protein